MPLSVLPHRDDLMRAAAERIAQLAERANSARGRFDWALAGGKTPEAVYRLLAGPPYVERIDWARVHFFWSDERCVPPDHADSNYRMARESLLDRVRPPDAHVHRMRGEQPPLLEARRYEGELGAGTGRAPSSAVAADPAASAPGDTAGAALPRLDLILLGMGADGHTASLFPGDTAVLERVRWVATARSEGPGIPRLTFTLPLINAAAAVLFLVAGKDKARTLASVMRRGAGFDAAAGFGSGSGGSSASPAAPLPAQLVLPTSGELEWLVDAEAASLL